MCGRYYIDIDDEDIRAVINAADKQPKTGEIFPTDQIPLLLRTGEVQTMKWGFTDFDGKTVIFNARSETVSEKPMFRRAMQNGRCLIPASYYFEWEKAGKTKVKHTLSLPDGGMMYFAGLMRRETDGMGACTILTRPAWSGIEYIHNRMPVILPGMLHDEWLNGTDGEAVLKEAVQTLAVDVV